MKKIIYLLSITFLILQSCSSDDSQANSDNEPVVEDNVKPPFTIKYELLFSKTCLNAAHVYYNSDERNNGLHETGFTSAGDKSWTKTITAKLLKNPYFADLATDAYFSEEAEVTYNVYVNNSLYFHAVQKRKANDNAFYGCSIPIY